MASTSEDWFIKDKTAIITGSNTGIGRATALELVRRGARRVILACRNLTQAEEAAREIRQLTNSPENVVLVRHLDLSSLASVRRFAAEIQATEPELHVLVNNAGIFGAATLTKSVDGNEITFETNHLGHFLLTNLLLDLLKKSAPSRVVTVSAHWFAFRTPFHIDDVNFDKNPTNYSRTRAYGYTKLANVLFTRELHRSLRSTGDDNVTTYVVHPGVVGTDIARDFHPFLRKLFTFFAKTPENGARNVVYCASQPAIEHLSSCYFMNCNPVNPGVTATDDEMAKKLWQLSENLVEKMSESHLKK